MDVAGTQHQDDEFQVRPATSSPPHLQPLDIESNMRPFQKMDGTVSPEEILPSLKYEPTHCSVSTSTASEPNLVHQKNSEAQSEASYTAPLLDRDTHEVNNVTGSSQSCEILHTLDGQRRKRRKPLVPPQKFPTVQLDTNEMTDSDEEYSGDFPKLVKISDATSVDSDMSSEVEQAKSTLPDSVIDKFSEQKENQFIHEISHQAVETVRQIICPSETKKSYDTQTELLLERTLSQLEPQISRLVGQSLRSSIETIREQVLAGLKSATSSISTDHNDTTTRKTSSTVESHNFASEVVSEFQNSSTSEAENLSNPGDKSEIVWSALKAASIPSFTINNLNLSCTSEATHGGEREPIPVSPETLTSDRNICLFRNKRLEKEDLTAQTRSLSQKLSESTEMSTDTGNCPNPLIDYTSQVFPYSNAFKLPLPQMLKPNFIQMAPDSLPAKNKCYRMESGNRKSSPNKTNDGFTIEGLGNSGADSYRTGELKEPSLNYQPDKMCSVTPQQQSFLQPETAGAAVLASAIGLQNAFLMNKNDLNSKLFSNFPVNTNEPPWPPSYLSQFGLSALTRLPLGLFPPLSGHHFSFPVSPSPTTMGRQKNSNQQLKPHNQETDAQEEQTEAIPLVVGRKTEEDHRPVSTSTASVPQGAPGMKSVSEIGNISLLTTPINGASTLSRRRRTKVTDTRLNSRGGSRSTFNYMSPRSTYTNGVADFIHSMQYVGAEARKTFENGACGNVANMEHFPMNSEISLRHARGGNEHDRSQSLLSPPSSSDVRLNSSSSSPSPSSVRLSNGPTDGSLDGDMHRSLSDKTRLLSSPTLHENRTTRAPMFNLVPGPRLSDSQPRMDFPGPNPQQCSETESFEQTLVRAFRTSPQMFRQRSINSLMNTINSQGSTRQSLINSLPPFNVSGCPVPFASQIGPLSKEGRGMSTEQHQVSTVRWERGAIQEPANFHGSLAAFERHVDGACKRAIGEALLHSQNCFEKEKLANMESNKLHHCVDGMRTTSTLTPVHLRKAKLMFFYTRYPNSTLIKMYFPDVKFYKNNTAQLVKWFSNFREFYYIQMEKFARVAISEGVRTADEIHVTTDSELYRALNLHYNRNQQLEVPDHFRIVVEATLREFFNALMTGKDTEQSWKKPIYKIIARMDQPVPEFFKNPNWMEQLADG
ncbi:homeobox protein prospero [Clonorchis sinensis]|uniref:Homeobox protein prospero n=1 Tax=Clonorchis sinensis TaxID=79923 RepID=G7YI99_CLOSI|nr:homeobox protein prospero [Clonorchis sinensis]